MKNKFLNKNEGFTLIELLVVIAIIGIISSVVIASLNSAREKSKISSIKSTLKQLYSQAALNQLENGSFAGSNTSSSDLTCTGPGNNLAKIVQPLIDQGIYVKCLSYSNVSYTDIYNRFGATALIYDTNELKAWSVDENGVVKWDLTDLTAVNLPGGNLKNFSDAKTACLNNGGRVPSIEQMRTLSYVWYIAALTSTGTGSYTPSPTNGVFWPDYYRSSNFIPSSPFDQSYIQSMASGGMTSGGQSVGRYVRCVR